MYDRTERHRSQGPVKGLPIPIRELEHESKIMAKKSAVNRNEMVKALVARYAARREALKAITLDASLPLEERFEARLRLAKLPRNSAPSRIRNRCEVTGRPRAFYRKLSMSRISLRKLANEGQIPGMTKSSW